MSAENPVEEYTRALDALASLTAAVARQERQREVSDAVAALRLAVARAFSGQAAPPRPGGARGAILDHLKSNVGKWVAGEELAAVASIGEWARRVRELRVELGYDIEEERGHYRLRSCEPDYARRARWASVTEVRDSGGEPLDRARLLLDRLVGQVVTTEELGRAARSRDAASLARKLRAEEQLPIEMVGDAADLRAGEFRLASTREAFLLPLSDGLFTEETRARAFRRDRYTCSICRRDHASASATPERPFYLLVRHVAAGTEDLAGLSAHQLTDLSLHETRCNECFGR